MSKTNPVQKLLGAGIDLKTRAVPDSMKKSAFVICNDYTEKKKWPELGGGPNNDAFHIFKICHVATSASI